MNYIEVMNDAIEYIENNLQKTVRLDELAAKYYISRYHFYRIFRSLTNATLAEYITQRRLSEAAKKIKATKQSIIDIAFDYGFESPETFSRSFKRFFKITPLACRNLDFRMPFIEKKEIVERKFKNVHNDIIVDFTLKHVAEFQLFGKRLAFKPTVKNDLDKVVNSVQEFLTNVIKRRNIEPMYNITKKEAGNLIYFTGCKIKRDQADVDFVELTVPESDYAVFKYSTDLFLIYKTVVQDISKALLVSGLKLNRSFADFISMEFYDHAYFKTKQFCIYIPVCKLD
ncbi:AraC family transcriptional regulator [Propionispira arboris]|uniref:AraC family transcriptional regulator n=1 Tax=Propionispira arboris TaxID=84035 RepID=A0A1H6VPD2_9FIRM|nr:helix-turn-helix domain-containing protein [Propionispira arboris]SEJ02092.1 AraC family transcriptional regulator [Propionispira arboris]